MNTKNFKKNIYGNISLFTEVYYNKTLLSTATSFAYLYNEKLFLITNYHVVSGRNAYTGELLDKKYASIPNKLKVYYKNASEVLNFIEIDLDKTNYLSEIYSDKGKERYYDVVAIKIDDNIDVLPVNGFKNEPHDILIGVTDNLFVLGYPESIHIDYTPIWKMSSIASEPSIPVNNLPFFYIDTATKEGMSGSPVILYSNKGNYRSVNGNAMLTAQIIYNFIGIYSGRDICKNEEEARLGIVWNEDAIKTVVSKFYSFTTTP